MYLRFRAHSNYILYNINTTHKSQYDCPAHYARMLCTRAHTSSIPENINSINWFDHLLCISPSVNPSRSRLICEYSHHCKLQKNVEEFSIPLWCEAIITNVFAPHSEEILSFFSILFICHIKNIQYHRIKMKWIAWIRK